MHLLSGGHMRRITKAALSGVAGCALILGATQVATGESSHITHSWSGKLTDLRPAHDGVPEVGPLDGASATLRIMESPDEGTGFRLRVTGIDPKWEDHDFGAHLHVGLCETPEAIPETEPVQYTNETAGHYIAPLPAGENEVWFDLVPDEEGVANDETWVQFVPVDVGPEGMSIVIHGEEASLPTIASPKQACLPVVVSDWKSPT